MTQKITDQAGNNGTKKVEIMVSLKHLSNFWRTLGISLINYEIKLISTWSEKIVIVSNTAANQGTTCAITDTKCYLPVLTLSTENNAKLLRQLKSGFKKTIGTSINQKQQNKRQT